MKKTISIYSLIFLCISLFADINDELIEAVESGDIENAQRFIAQGADVNAKDWHGCTILMVAALKGHIKLIELLINEGADLAMRDYNGLTVLMYAALGGYKGAVK